MVADGPKNLLPEPAFQVGGADILVHGVDALVGDGLNRFPRGNVDHMANIVQKGGGDQNIACAFFFS